MCFVIRHQRNPAGLSRGGAEQWQGSAACSHSALTAIPAAGKGQGLAGTPAAKDEQDTGRERAFPHTQIGFCTKTADVPKACNVLWSCASASFLSSFQIQMQIKFDGLSL